MAKSKRLKVATCPVCYKVYKGEYAGNAVAGCIGIHKNPYKGVAGTNAVVDRSQTEQRTLPNAVANATALPTDTKDNPGGDWVDWLDADKDKGQVKDAQIVINNTYPSQVMPFTPQPIVPYTPQSVVLKALGGAVEVQPNIKAMKWIFMAMIGLFALAILADSGAFSNSKGGESSGLGIIGMAGMALGMSKKIRTELKGWDVI